MLGKQKCRFLKEIRRRIADENDIPFVTEDCSFHGNCKGTCPKCESELRYLEAQLEKRRALGKKVTISAIALGLLTGTSACGKEPAQELSQGKVANGGTEESELLGDVPNTDILEGEVAETEPTDPVSSTEFYVLEGDVAYNPQGETDDNTDAPELDGALEYPSEDALTAVDDTAP